MEKKVGEKVSAFFEGFSIFILLVLFLVIIATTYTTSAPLLMVILGFSPSMITIIACIILFEETRHKVIMVWALPFILAGAFFFIGTSSELMSTKLDITGLTAINLFLSLVYLGIFFFLLSTFTKGKKEESYAENETIRQERIQNKQQRVMHSVQSTQLAHAPIPRHNAPYQGQRHRTQTGQIPIVRPLATSSHMLQQQQVNIIQPKQEPQKQIIVVEKTIAPETKIREYVASIEDKSKAINFVVGRVYSKHHEGSRKLREKILIPPEWYNEFSELEEKSLNDKKRLLPLVERIEKRLKLLEEPEENVFGEGHVSLKNLKRDKRGNDSILKVLINNDKDPVETYHKGALEFCQKLKEELQK